MRALILIVILSAGLLLGWNTAWGASAGDIVITEVMPNPKGVSGAGQPEDTDEYIELYNTTASSIDVGGWYIKQVDIEDTLYAWDDKGEAWSGTAGVVTDTTSIPAGGYAVIVDQEYDDGTQPYNFPSGTIILVPDDTSICNELTPTAAIYLRETSGGTVISSYGDWETPSDPGDGRSWEIIDIATGDTSSNWQVSITLNSSEANDAICTPGAATNILSAGDVVINEVMAKVTNTYDNEWIELYNTRSDGVTIDLQGWTIDSTTIPDATHIAPGEYLVIADDLDDSADSDLLSFERTWGNADDSWDEGVDPNETYTAIDGATSIVDDGETLTLANDLGTTIDTEDIPATSDYDHSQERKDYDTDPGTWEECATENSPAATNDYGTPGAQNSNYSGGAEVTVTKTDVPILSLQAGEANQTVFAATISGDSGGDFLNSFIFMNSGGTMQDTLDIDAVNLWDDSTGSSPNAYDGADTLIDTLAWDGTDSWDNTNTELNYTVPAEGLDIVVTIDVSVSPTDGRTFTGQIPANGISMATATDGPASASTNANTQEVNTQVSTSELNKQDALAAHVCADDDNKLALTFDIPDDGGLADTLTAIKVYNAETTNPMDNTDIEFLKVWEDVDGDDTFDTVADTPHTLTWNTDPDHWEASGLTISIPAGGKTFFVSIDITSSPTVGNKFQAKLPLATAITLSSTINTLEADCINNNAQTVVVNTWETLTPPALGVGDNNGHRIEAMSGYVYMWVAYGAADGESCSESTAFYQYDPDGGSWDDNWNVSYNETAPIDSSYGIDIVRAKDTLGNPAIYILGGTTTDESEEFYRWTESNGWSIALADITWNASVGQKKPRNGSTLVWDGDDIIYYFPGSGYDYSQQDWYKYTISTNTWAEIGSASLPVIQGPGNAACLVTIDSTDYIYIQFGTTPSGSYTAAKFYRYPLPSGPWEELTKHPYGADDGSDLVWDGGDYIYHSPGAWAEGGNMPEPKSPNESRLLRYSISGNSWTEMHEQPLDVPANGGSDDGGASALIGDYIYRLKGGDDLPVSGGSTASTDFFRYLDLLPTVNTYSPEDDATGVVIDTNLVLTFSETVTAQSGDIVIKNTADNTEFETIPVGDARVEVAGATVTINPTGTFANSTGYYVQIAATCFDNEAGNSYTGIADTTIWNFTTAAGVSAPTVTTQAASDVEEATATGKGTITATGGENCDKRGIVYDTSTHGDPGNTAPAVSEYSNYEEETDSFGAEAFTRSLTSLTPGTKYYARTYAHNSAGYSYGDEVSFVTKPNPPTNLASSDVTGTTATVSWTAPAAGSVDGYYIRYKVGSTPTSHTDGDGYTTSETSKGLTGLSPNTHYYCKVWSYATDSSNADGCCDDPGVSAECDFTTEAGASAPTVTSITPNSGTNDGTVNITNLAGTNFVDGATVKLTKTDETDITATNVIWASSTKITCTFDLTGKTVGEWNVVVTNPDTQFGTLTDGFTITLPASALRINEVAPSESSSKDWIEFYVATAGDYHGYIVREGATSVKTFPAEWTSLSAGDYIVLHFENSTTDETTTDTNGNGYWDIYDNTTGGLTATDNVITISNAADTTIVDAMCFADQDAPPDWTGNDTWANNAIDAGQWTATNPPPSDDFEADCADNSSAGAGKSLGRDSSSTDTDNSGTAKNDWQRFTIMTPGEANVTISPNAGNLLINEVSFNDGTNDWVELYVVDGSVDWTNYVLVEDISTVATIPAAIGAGVETDDYIVIHEEAGTDDTIKSDNNSGYWDMYEAGSFYSTDDIIQIKDSLGRRVDAVLYSNNDGPSGWTRDNDEAQEVVTDGLWDATADFTVAGGDDDSDAWTDSGDVGTDETIGRDSSSTDTNAKGDWSLFTTQTEGSANTAGGTAGGGGGYGGYSGCFIASAAYGGYTDDHRFITDGHRSQITTLQNFRDEYLLTNVPGRAFVRFYYRHSPPVADFIRDKKPLKAMVRAGLKPLVWVAEKVTQ